ncbi:hypothetical protein FBU59_004966 [Linderina macrospora]|uniref:Uncharacterized protein n=1 Tax=Linderina macrospora TaxID=4868 RepID=A0ACC1J426_9FUNG|nr:hypothetical protein FBU59_004966 [Linderina macrospora]
MSTQYSDIPDFILSSGLAAQRSRVSRIGSRGSSVSPRSSIDINSEPVSPRAIDEDGGDDDDCEAVEIKSVLGHVPFAQNAWPREVRFDMPRLVKF